MNFGLTKGAGTFVLVLQDVVEEKVGFEFPKIPDENTGNTRKELGKMSVERARKYQPPKGASINDVSIERWGRPGGGQGLLTKC